MTASSPAMAELFGELQKNWGWLLALGIVSIVLGTVGLGMAFWLTLASVLFFGVIILVQGVIELFQAFRCKGWKGILGHLAVAALHVVAGLVIVADPLLASFVFTLLLAGAILVTGVLRIVMAFQHRDATGWGWLLFGGVVAVVLGLMILSRWPVSGLWVIGLFVAIELIMNGWSAVILALAARAAGRGAPGAAPSPA